MNKLTAILVLIVSVIHLSAPPCAADGPGAPTTASAPAGPELQWGASRAGLQLSLSQGAAVTAGGDGKFSIRVAMRNVGMLGVRLGDGAKVFAWLTVVRARDEAWLTAKIAAGDLLVGWPNELEAGKSVSSRVFDASALAVYEYSFRRQILTNYLAARGANVKKLPPPAGRLGQVMSEGKLTVLCRLCIGRPGQKTIILSSNKLSIEVAAPLLKSLTPEQRKAYLDKLVARFNKDPWAGQAAHHAAVKIGKPAVPYLIKAVSQRNRPVHARMWLATALADIRDERAAEALILLLQDSLAGVRQVVAYHGPKQRNKKLDDAIIATALKLKESRMTALAMLGFLIARGHVADQLLAVSLESDDPRVRATAAKALSRHASVDNLKHLANLLQDKDPKVRGVAAGALGAMQRGGVKVIGALITALDLPGDSAKYRICKALMDLTGQKIVYDPQATQQQRDRTVKAWNDWWKAHRSEKSPQ